MPLFLKPQFNSVWANTGTKLTPEPAKISQGWVVEIPPYEFDNWIQNRQDALLAHLNQVGIPTWDSTVEYQAGKSYVQGVTTGVVYRALTTNTNINPEIDIQNNWTVAFQSSGTALLKSQNLADVPDKALARSNLGIATTEFYDERYLKVANNLSDVPSKSTARNNLGLGNSATRDVGTAPNTVAAGDDSRIVNATPQSRRIVAGNGLTGGGDLSSDKTISLATPSSVTATSSNTASPVSHTHSIDLSSFMPTVVTNMTASRAFGVNYVNNTPKYRYVSIVCRDPGAGNLGVQLFVNGVLVSQIYAGQNNVHTIQALVPPSGTYQATRTDDNDVIVIWTEYL